MNGTKNLKQIIIIIIIGVPINQFKPELKDMCFRKNAT